MNRLMKRPKILEPVSPESSPGKSKPPSPNPSDSRDGKGFVNEPVKSPPKGDVAELDSSPGIGNVGVPVSNPPNGLVEDAVLAAGADG